MSGDQKFYSEDEAQQILSAASRSQIESNRVSRELLLRTAAELNLTPEDVARAEEELHSMRQAVSNAEEEKALRIEFDKHERAKFISHIVEASATLAICTLIWYMLHMHYFWPGWVAFGFGIETLSKASSRLDPIARDKRFKKWLRKRDQEDDDPAKRSRL